MRGNRRTFESSNALTQETRMRWPFADDVPDPMRTPPALPAPPDRRAAVAPRTVLLVNPFYAKDPHASFGKHVLTPSLALTSLAAATPPEWSVSYWDENLLSTPAPVRRLSSQVAEPVGALQQALSAVGLGNLLAGPAPVSPVPQVVGITVHLTFAERAYALARFFRALGSTVILGGLHAWSCPDEVAAHADAIAVGNGVPLWPRILADVEAGRLARRYDAPFADFAAEPVPDRGVLPAGSFLTRASLIATRGCHNRCDFCWLATGEKRMRYEMRPPDDVARELADSGEPYGVFLDNNLGSSKPYLRRLCRALAPLGKIWSAAVTIDVTDDPSLVREMALSGCTGVFVGFESLQDDNLRDAGKRTPRAADYARRIELFHDHGIQVNGSFVVGFDHDRSDCFGELADWIEEQRLECATFHILTPYPGTPLFARLQAEGRILHRNWSRYDTGHAVFRPKHMSAETLEEGYGWLYRRLFSARSIWARRPRQASAVPAYLGMAVLYKRCNPLWSLLIRHDLTHAVWRPLVELTRRRHLRARAALAASAARPEVVGGGTGLRGLDRRQERAGDALGRGLEPQALERAAGGGQVAATAEARSHGVDRDAPPRAQAGPDGAVVSFGDQRRDLDAVQHPGIVDEALDEIGRGPVAREQGARHRQDRDPPVRPDLQGREHVGQ